jgi:hypothetical protein
MRASWLPLVLATVAACGGTIVGSGDGDGGNADACVGLQCFQVSCPGGGTTSLSGTVFAPNGTLPLYNVNVYVPNSAVDPLPAGATCDRCGQPPSGNPVVSAVTDTEGKFVLENVPVVDNLPLVIQVGKWRRQVMIPTAVPACTDTPLDATVTRLPRNKSEGDIPQMALTTGGADALECLLRKIGLDDSEFTNASGTGRVHLYAGTGGATGFSPALGGADFTDAQTLWDTTAHLTPYDVTFLSCEGSQNPATKPATARQALSDYTDLGGRVFASHWHNIWIDQGPVASMWPAQVTPNYLADLGSVTADINTGFAKGAALAQWLMNVGGSTTLGKIALNDAQHTVQAVATTVDTWISVPINANGVPSIQYYQFTTPLANPADQRCGKVAFSDIHVSTGDDSSPTLRFPTGCTTTGLTPQEKVLAFMIFDIASCVGPDIGHDVPEPAASVPETPHDVGFGE